MDPALQPERKQSAALPVPDFRAVFESAPSPFLLVLPDDPVFTIVAASDAYVRVSGVRREDLLGRGVFEVFPDNPYNSTSSGVRNVRASFRRAIATRAPDKLPSYRFDVELPVAEGGGFEKRYWIQNNTPVLGADGRVQYLLHSAEDVTDKIRAEQREHLAVRELRTSNTRFQQLAGASTLGLVIGDLEGRLSYVNPAVRELLGYTEEEVAVGLVRWDQITPPEFAALDAKAVRQLTATGRCPPYEKVYIAKNGRRVPILVGASLLESANGQTEVAAFVLDLTERKHAERRDAFLVQLDDAVRPLTDPHEITQTAARLLGEHLQVDRVAYCRFEADQETFHIAGDYTRPGVPSMVGRYTLSLFGMEAAQSLRANLPYVVEDIESDPRTADVRATYRQFDICADLGVPLYKTGRLVAALAAHQRTPRRWRPEEVDLVQLVAYRCWESMSGRSRMRTCSSSGTPLIPPFPTRRTSPTFSTSRAASPMSTAHCSLSGKSRSMGH
ncbi:MAG: PAS domain S-box protein [Bryobacteraceae bacterium]